MVNQLIRIPESCPVCRGQLCVEWDYQDATQSRVHCRKQDQDGPDACTYSELVGAETGYDGYTIIHEGETGTTEV